jgi:hypothetical protein
MYLGHVQQKTSCVQIIVLSEQIPQAMLKDVVFLHSKWDGQSTVEWQVINQKGVYKNDNLAQQIVASWLHLITKFNINMPIGYEG